MEVLTGEQMRRADAHAIGVLRIPGPALMESAGREVAQALLADHPDLATRGVLVLAGKGNNGGDGLVVARHLAEHGVRSRVLLLGEVAQLSPDAALQLPAARGVGVEVVEVADSESWRHHAASLRPPVVVVDAMLGTGVQGGARGLVAEVIEDLNASGLDVAAIDLPSGLDADRPQTHGAVVRASSTYTLCRPKLPLASGQADEYCGRWRVVPIGIPDESVVHSGPTMEWLDDGVVRQILPPRRTTAHKGELGHVLVVAGSRGKTGAAGLAALGALRVGAGLVTVASPASVRGEVAVRALEIMTADLPDDGEGSLAFEAAAAVVEQSAGRDALAIGPGVGTAPGARAAVRDAVLRATLPAVIDADALNAFAEHRAALEELRSRPRAAVLTPHPGEAARLLGVPVSTIQADRPGAALRLAGACGAVVVLKGHRSAIAAPDGRLAFNATGNPGLATAGTGDVLTGVIAALLARGLPPWDAARAGTFLHGLAGDLAVQELGPEGMIASDILGKLPRALERTLHAKDPR